MMISHNKSFISSTICCPFLPATSRRICRNLKPTLAKKQDVPENLEPKQHVLPTVEVPNVFFARTAIAVLGLGFIDAGYSGDWSRIGAISRETEEFLKVAAYVVTPLSLLLILSFSKVQDDL